MKKYLKLLRSYSPKVIAVAGLKEIYRKTWKETIRGSYAQNYEDLIIEKLFDKNYIGKYLEIGAYHPSRLSNTYRLYKKDWRGIVIEPNPDVKNIFLSVRPGDNFLNIGISDKNQNLDYYRFLIPALNTFSKIDADKNIKKGHKLEKVVKIETKKIDEIIDERIDFLSIDTEGFDEMILENWPWKKQKPKVICVEDGRKNINKIMKNQGYSLCKRTKYNSIFLKN
jgi:FkbM family methyltransferase